MGKHFSFIHCADLHLGEPFGDVRLGGSGPWNEQISKSTFKAFEKVVDAAIDNRVDAILISGDVYNSDHHSLAAQMAFARELYRAAENGIETFIVHGNHDPEEAWRADIPLPDMVHIFSSSEVQMEKKLQLFMESATRQDMWGLISLKDFIIIRKTDLQSACSTQMLDRHQGIMRPARLKNLRIPGLSTGHWVIYTQEKLCQ